MHAAIIGAGPAGWLAAGAAQSAGWDVTLLDPDPERIWSPTYCAWVDTVPQSFRAALGQVWDQVDVVWSDEDSLSISRPYGCFDNRALQARCRQDAGATHLELTTVAELERKGTRVQIRTQEGRTLEADMVLDCTGVGRFVRRASGPAAAQTAVGVFASGAGTAAPPRPVFMDLRESIRQPGCVPTFGYVLPFAADRVLVEETVLAGRPVVPPDALRSALSARMKQYGIQSRPADEEEKVFIPMGGGYPLPRQTVAAYGAAASMVHPATGYLLAFMLRRQAALQEGFSSARLQGDPESRVAALHRVVFDASLRGTRQLHALGLEVLLRLDRGGLQRFFRAFFGSPEWAWQSYLQADTKPGTVASAMLRVFGGLDGRDRWRVLTRVGAAAIRPAPGLPEPS